MNLKKHHTGIISKNIDRDAEIYFQLGYCQFGEKTVDTVQHNILLFCRKDDDIIELIQPLDDNSTVKSARPGVHHFCFETPDIELALAEIRQKRLGTMFAKFDEAPALGNRRIAFVCLRTGSIIELLEA